MSGAGIDYSGPGAGCNRDAETGIRYGIISQNAVLQAWADGSEPDYGPPTCGECGCEATPAADYKGDIDELIDAGALSAEPHEAQDYVCETCCRVFGNESAYGNEPNGFTYDANGIQASSDSDGDIWITRSPYYTRAAFCSPCAPGACHLENPTPDGERCYCLPPDWFDDEEPCPYPVWRVDSDELVYTPAQEIKDS